MRKVVLLLLLLAAPLLRAGQTVDLLVYRVEEPGLAPYISRILVSDAFVRIDEGAASTAGYTLYNRVSRRIYNVDPEEETVLVLDPPPRQPRAPAGLELESRLAEEPDAPQVAGRRPRRLELLADGRLCRTLQVVDGLMPRAVQGLRELRLALARLQGEPTPEPGEAPAPCELAEYLYAPARSLEHGLPLVDLLMDGRRQWLLDYDPDFPAEADLFRIPEHYRLVVPPALGSG